MHSLTGAGSLLPLLERAYKRVIPPELLEAERIIARLVHKPDRATHKKLEQVLSKFFGIKIQIKPVREHVLMFVVPYLALKQSKQTTPTISTITGDKITFPRRITRIVIYYNPKIWFQDIGATPREFLAAILHEVGHIPTAWIATSIELGRYVGRALPVILGATVSIIYAIISLLLSAAIHTYMSHRVEYAADSFATKMGYGDDLISLFQKIKVYEAQLPGYKKMLMTLISFILHQYEHPSDEKRQKAIAKDILEKFGKYYPKSVLDDLKEYYD